MRFPDVGADFDQLATTAWETLVPWVGSESDR